MCTRCHAVNLIPSNVLIRFFWIELSLSLFLSVAFFFLLGTIKSNGMNSFIAKVSFLKRATLLDKSKLQLLLKTFQEFHRNELYYVDGKRCSSSQLNFMSTLFLIHSRCVYEDDFFTWHLIGTFINTKTRAVHFFPLHDSFHADILI